MRRPAEQSGGECIGIERGVFRIAVRCVLHAGDERSANRGISGAFERGDGRSADADAERIDDEHDRENPRKKGKVSSRRC
jgi:hypothetical protein